MTNSEPKPCPRCQTNTIAIGLPACIPCITGWAWAADALDLRVLPPAHFSLLAFRRAAPTVCSSLLTTDSLQNLTISIIKGCEYYQQPAQRALLQRFGPPSPLLARPPTTGTSKTQNLAHQRKNQLLTDLLTASNGLCTYCGNPLTHDQATVDTVIGTGLRHSGTSAGIAYYDAMRKIGNAVASCPSCNWSKGRQEAAGTSTLRSLARGINKLEYAPATVLSVAELPGIATCSGRQFAQLATATPDGIARATAETEPYVLRALAAACLRVVVECACETSTLIGQANPNLRHISFKCPRCRPPRDNHIVIKLDRKRTPIKINLDTPQEIAEYERA